MSESILDGLDDCPLHKLTPYGFRSVSRTQLSIARHTMGIRYNGEEYIYSPPTDELIRMDVQKWKAKKEKEANNG